MDGQDWTPVIINKPKPVKNTIQTNHEPNPDVDVKIEAPKNLGQQMCQARTTKSKTQKQLANELGIATQVISRWETNKEIPSNSDLAKIEKNLGVKLPRTKKIKVDAH